MRNQVRALDCYIPPPARMPCPKEALAKGGIWQSKALLLEDSRIFQVPKGVQVHFSFKGG
jgi:hypothetical protein